MKKILSISLLCGVALAFTGCVHEEDDIFDKSAAERLNEAKDVYFSRLTDSEAGWAMEYYPTNGDEAPQGAGYLMLADFNKDNSVKVGMRNSMTGNNYLEDTSVWEVITDNGPVLSFSTYNNCVHLFSDPGIYETGLGYEGDYEFVIVDMEQGAQQGFIKGKKRGTYVRLTRLPEQTDFQEYINDVQSFQSRIFSASAPNLDYIHYGTDSLMVLAEGSTGIPNIYPYGKDAIAFESYHPYLIIKKDDQYYLRFKNVLTTNSDNVAVQEFKYDADQDKFFSIEDQSYYIEGENPGRFLNDKLTGTSTSHWQFNRTSEKSSSVQELYDNIYNDFQTIEYTVENMTISRIADVTALRITCSYMKRQGTRYVKQSVTYVYDFDISYDGENLVMKYTAPENAASTTAAGTFASIPAFLNALSKTYNVEAETTRFNLGSVRMTAADNSGFWLTITLL